MAPAISLRDFATNITKSCGVKLRAGITDQSSGRTRSLKVSLFRKIRGFRVLIQWAYPRKLFGLRVGRVREWLAVLQDNDSSPGWRGWAEMAGLAVRAIFGRRNQKAVPDYRKCIRCPIHDRALKRCGANDGLGCSCFTVYAVAAGKPCWGKVTLEHFEFGYD